MAGRDASLELVDTMPSPELTSQILDVVRSVAGVQGIESALARKPGLHITSTCTSRSIQR